MRFEQPAVGHEIPMTDIVLILVALFALGLALLTVARSYRNPWRMLLLAIPLLAVLTPGFGSAPAVRVEEILLLALAPIIILRKPIYRLAKVEFLFLLYGTAVLFSILLGYLLDGTIFSRDFMELARLAKYWLMVRLAITLPWSKDHVSDAVKVLLYTGLVAACIAFAQSRDSFAINSVYTPLFIKDFRLHTVQRQVPGTIQNYNLFGAFLAMVASVAWGILLFASTAIREKAITAVILAALILALVMTTSKGGFVALLLAMALLWLLRLALIKKRRFVYGVMLVVALAAAIPLGRVALGTPESLAAGHPFRAIAGRFQPEHLELSYQLRLSDWKLAVELATDSIVFGSGPSKDEEVLTFHSEYLTHLRRYGLVGLAIYLLLLMTATVTLLSCLKKDRTWSTTENDLTGALLVGTLGSILVFAITGGIYQVFQQLQLAAIFWWLVGIAYAYCHSASLQQEKTMHKETHAPQPLGVRGIHGQDSIERQGT
jgi:hypothetical protein